MRKIWLKIGKALRKYWLYCTFSFTWHYFKHKNQDFFQKFHDKNCFLFSFLSRFYDKVCYYRGRTRPPLTTTEKSIVHYYTRILKENSQKNKGEDVKEINYITQFVFTLESCIDNDRSSIKKLILVVYTFI